MPLVIELEESWAVGVVVLEMKVVNLGLVGCVATLLADVHLLLEVSFVVELEQRRAVGVVLLQMDVVNVWLVGGVAALLANVHLCPTLLVGILVLDPVNLETV